MKIPCPPRPAALVRAAAYGFLFLALFVVGCADGRGGISAASSTVSAATAGAGASTGIAAPRPRTAVVVRRYGDGFLEDEGGRLIVHVKGTSYEQGLQYGELLQPQIEGVFQKVLAYARQNFSQLQNVPPFLTSLLQPLASSVVAGLFRSHLTVDDLDLMRGIVHGMRIRSPGTPITEADLIMLNSIVDLAAILEAASFKCSSFAAWGSLTQGGKVYQTRNIDLMVGTGLEEYPVVAIHKPTGGVPYMNLGYVGIVGVVSGLNGHGLGMGQVWAMNKDNGIGRPWPLIVREVMAKGEGYEDAIRAFAGQRVRTYGANLVFADRGDGRGGRPGGCSIEVTHTRFAAFLDDDPREDQALWQGQPYAIRIPEAVFRGDCSMDPLIRATQTSSNGPRGDPRTAGAYQKRYKGQADLILDYQARGIPIGRDEAEAISRQVAMTKVSLQCCVYENTDLRAWVANARMAGSQVLQAYQEPFHPYDLGTYVPTVRVLPDRRVVRAGDAVQATFLIGNLGQARELDLRVFLETAAGSQATPFWASPHRMVVPARGAGQSRITLTVPAGLVPGDVVIRVDVCERGSTDLVDSAAATITVQ